MLRGQLYAPKNLRQLLVLLGHLESQWFAPGRHTFRVVHGDTWKLRAFLGPRFFLLAPFRSRESRIRRLSDADGFPPDPLHEAIACAQVSCLFVHEVSEHHGPAGCEVVSAMRFVREGVHFEHDLPLHWWIHHLEFIADGAGRNELHGHALVDPLEHAGATRLPDVGTPVLVDVNVTLQDTAARRDVDSAPQSPMALA